MGRRRNVCLRRAYKPWIGPAHSWVKVCLALGGRKDLQIQLDSHALEIAALKAELANRKSQDVAAAELTSRLKADLQEAKTGFERATISLEYANWHLDCANREKEAYRHEADQLRSDCCFMQLDMKTMEEYLRACAEREAFLEDELQRLRSELSARADLDKISGQLARARSILQRQKGALQSSENEISVLKSYNKDLEEQRNIALADVNKGEERLTRKTQFMRWNVRRSTLEEVKAGIANLDAAILTAREMEAKAEKDMLPTPQLSPADIHGDIPDEGEDDQDDQETHPPSHADAHEDLPRDCDQGDNDSHTS